LCENTEVKMPPGVSRRLSWKGGELMNQFLNLSSFAEQMLVHENSMVKIDPDIPLDRAALVGCGVMTGVGSVLNTAQVPPGATVAVIGCGGVGISVIQGARISGATVIAAIDPAEGKHELARRFGATHAGHPDDLDQLKAELTGGEGFDYAFEVVGLPQTIRSAWSAARRGGSVIVVGAGRADQQVEFTPFELLFDGKKLLPSLYGNADVRRDYTRMLSLWRAGLLDLEGMITQHVTLDDLDDALAALGQGEVIRQVISYD
jgi:S-(hydroxymethyl)glutathione dehydrogenase/alcohol dehydrogenase